LTVDFTNQRGKPAFLTFKVKFNKQLCSLSGKEGGLAPAG
jgi:hypothetical protein